MQGTKQLKTPVDISDLGPSKQLKAAFAALSSNRRRLFFREYFLGGMANASAAAIRAGYRESGAWYQSNVMLHSAAGRKLMKLWLEEIGVTPESIMAEFHRINNANLYDYRGLFHGKSLDDLHKSGIDLRQIKKMKAKVKKVKVDGEDEYEMQEIEIELYDRLKALVTQAKLLKLFGDDGDGLGASVVLDLLDAASEKIRTRPEDVAKAVADRFGADNDSPGT